MKKAIIYARVSSTTDRQSTDRQVADLNRYAQANDIEVEKVFEEHISGAKKNEERPVLMAAIEYAKANAIDVVLLSELSRLGRSVYEVQATVKELVDNNINAYSLKESLSLFNEDGTQSIITPILIAVLGTCAQIERENIAYRLASGRKQAVARGVKMGRKVGSVMSVADKEEKYAEILKKIRKGDKLTDILAWAKGKGYKVSYATLKGLKRDLC
ncbi:MAG: recombinase family protein [Bacteroidetes bacterium]|uniref:Recombinase family protein n=1 Tax=Candidatus Cryptobacteroides intestinavium TaxID=2840766 RepID=A0A9D9ESN9_9BACT|nr:recombinase family protein [Candidatus Cryptobacteroides intestinavium]